MHVYVYSLVIRSIRPPRRGGERDRVESVCNILLVPSLIIAPARQSRPRARDSPTRRRTSRDGTPEHHKKSTPSASVASSSRARSRPFVRSLTHRPSALSRAQVKAKERELRVLMVGLDNAGKTTVVKRVNGESIDEISPTLGFNIKTMTYGDYSLNVWDVGGQKTLRAYWRNYYEATDGLIWVVDSADSRRMRDCAEALASVLEEEKLAGASVLVFANKRDIRGAMDVDAIADALGLKRLVNRHWHIVGCSAVTGEGLLDGFDWLVNDCAERIYMLA